MPLIRGWIDALTRQSRSALSRHDAGAGTDRLVSTAIAALLQDRPAAYFSSPGLAMSATPTSAAISPPGLRPTQNSSRKPARWAGLPDGATPLHTTLDSSLLRAHYGLEVPDVWDVVERVATNTRDKVASPTHA